MYFFNNTSEHFYIKNTESFMEPDKFDTNPFFVYNFNVSFKQISEVNRCFLSFHLKDKEFRKNNNNHVDLLFDLSLKQEDRNNFDAICNHILETFEKEGVLDYFFNSVDKISIPVTRKENGLIDYFIIKVEGDLKFDIYKEYLLMLFSEWEPKIKELNNKEVFDFLIEQHSKIQNDFNLSNSCHPILNQYANLFDVNSNNFKTALELHYSG